MLFVSAIQRYNHYGRLLVTVVVSVERKGEGRVIVFYLCPKALMRWGGGGGQKNILHHQGELEKNI